jgi:hypothetical protein
VAAREEEREILPEANRIIAMMKANIEMWQKEDQPAASEASEVTSKPAGNPESALS